MTDMFWTCLMLCSTAFLMLWPSTMIGSSAGGESPAVVKLPGFRPDGRMPLERAILLRRSVRDYRDEPLSLGDVAQLLWSAQGSTSPRGFRTAPSAGALYPLEVYLVAGRVDGLAPGVFRYRPAGHELLKVFEGDRRVELASAALGQSWVKDAPASIVISAVYDRTTGKYRERGIRYVHMEAGHAAQNVCLQAVALELGSVVVGAFVDSDVKKVLHMPESEDPLAIIPVGRMR
jgi:SagB-type dehydrogenase family enzyme